MLRSPVRRLAPLLALVAVAVSACSSVGANPAATVNGEKISTQEVQDELEIIRGNKQFREIMEQQQIGKTLAGSAKGTFNSAFTAQLLSLRIYYELVGQSLRSKGIAPSAKDEEASRTQMREQLKALGGKKFSDAYVSRLAHQFAVIQKAQEEAAGGKIGKEYFAEHEDSFTQACVSHILVATENRSEAEAKRIADDLKRQLDGGADFVALAGANTDDPGTKETGGDLDCGPKGRFVPEFDAAAFDQAIGVVGEPVKTNFGYHLILVRSRSAATFEQVASQVGEQAFQAYLIELTCGTKTKVTVNPRYGRWNRTPCKDSSGLAEVSAATPPTNTKQ